MSNETDITPNTEAESPFQVDQQVVIELLQKELAAKTQESITFRAAFGQLTVQVSELKRENEELKSRLEKPKSTRSGNKSA